MTTQNETMVGAIDRAHGEMTAAQSELERALLNLAEEAGKQAAQVGEGYAASTTIGGELMLSGAWRKAAEAQATLAAKVRELHLLEALGAKLGLATRWGN